MEHASSSFIDFHFMNNDREEPERWVKTYM